MITDFIKGVFSYLDAFSFISKHNLRRYYWYCGIVGLIIMAFIVTVIGLFSADLSSLILSLFNVEADWIMKFSTILVKVIVSILFFILFKYLVLIFTAPIMSKLSEEVENILNEDFISIPFSFTKIVSDFIRAIRLAVRNIIRELLYTLGLIILGLFPVFTIATTPLIFLVQAYFAGFGNIDFYVERHFNTRETIEFVKDNKGLSAGNGTVYVLLLAIPVLGVFFAPALGSTAAALQVHNKLLTQE